MLLGAVVVGVTALWLVDRAIHRGQVPRNVEVAGIGLGGSDRDAATEALREVTAAWAQSPVTIETPAGAVTATAGDLGVVVDVDATVDAALDASPGNPIAWLTRIAGIRTVEPKFTVDTAILAAAVSDIDLGERAPVPPSIDLVAGQLVLTEGTPGESIDVDRLAADLARSFDPAGTVVLAELVDVVPPEPDADTAELVTLVNATTAGGIEVEVGGRTERVATATLRSWLLLDTASNPPALALADDAVQSWLDDQFGDLDVEGTDAVVIVLFGSPTIVGGDPAITCCGPASAARILDAILRGDRDVALEPIETPTEHGREWAESLGVVELVGEFTTSHPAGQPRVANIHRIADLIQGVIIAPGETFSVNDFVGPRTAEDGFVSAPVIQDGVFSEGIGGGISQFATTLFNAAFFAGLDFGEYQSHSVYISRYPYGREATLSFPSPDLEIHNPTPHSVLVWPSYTESSITVSLYSTLSVDVQQTGQTESAQGASCTRVVTERTRTHLDGRTEIDTVTALYRPEGVRCSGEPSRPPTTTTTTTTTTTLPPPTTIVPPVTAAPTIPPVTTPPTIPPVTVPDTAAPPPA